MELRAKEFENECQVAQNEKEARKKMFMMKHSNLVPSVIGYSDVSHVVK